MATKIKDLKIAQGSTFEWLIPINDINGTPLDMVGYAGGTAGARGMIRKKASDASPSATFSVTILNNTGILAKIAAGLCHLTTAEIAALEPDLSGSCYLLVRLTATTTAAMAKGSYQLYDIEIEDTHGYTWKPYTGSVEVSAEATK